MKKLFLLFATVTLLVGMQACKQKEAATDTATEVSTDSTAAVTTVPDDSTSAAKTESGSGEKPITIPTDPNGTKKP